MIQHLFKKNIYYSNNVEEIIAIICSTLHIRVSEIEIRKALISNNRFPSIQSIIDTLNYLGIQASAYRIKERHKFLLIEYNSIVQVKDNDLDFFGIILKRTTDKLYWFNPISHKKEWITIDSFFNLFTGTIIPFNKTHTLNFPFYEDDASNHIGSNSKIFFAILSIIVLVTLIIPNIVLNGVSDMFRFYLILLLTFGALCGSAILQLEIHNFEGPIGKVCRIGKFINCHTVLTSKASHIYNIPWSIIGTSYFCGTILFLLSNNFSDPSLKVFGLLHFFSIFIIVSSTFYQALYLKKWCILCLSANLSLLLIWIINMMEGIYADFINFSMILMCQLLLWITISMMVLQILSEHVKLKKRNELLSLSNYKYKYDKNIFNTLLRRNGKPIEIPKDMGLFCGNPNGEIKLLMISNPNCQQCSKACSFILDHLIYNENICLQIIFVDESPSHYHNLLAEILEEYYSCNNSLNVLNKLSKDFDKGHKNQSFGDSYPAFRKQTLSNIEKMHSFCNIIKPTATPTFYINGFKVPESYDIRDIYFILTF